MTATHATATHAVGRLPSFLVIGAMKAGTTSLFHYLRAHPQIYMCPVKELEFFAEESNWRRGLDWYRAQFATAGPDVRAVGEASTLYTKYPRYRGVPRRIATHVPEARLLYVIRDPIERIRSHYQHRVAEGSERAPFETAVFENPIYVDYSRYALQIEQYLECFAREQLLVITSEALHGARHATMRQVYAHLGVDDAVVPEELEREFYRTDERPARSSVPLGVRKTLKRILPAAKRAVELEANVLRALDGLRRRLGGAAPRTRPFGTPRTVRERLVRLLEDDVRRLRRHLGPDFDGWGIG